MPTETGQASCRGRGPASGRRRLRHGLNPGAGLRSSSRPAPTCPRRGEADTPGLNSTGRALVPTPRACMDPGAGGLPPARPHLDAQDITTTNPPFPSLHHPPANTDANAQECIDPEHPDPTSARSRCTIHARLNTPAPLTATRRTSPLVPQRPPNARPAHPTQDTADGR